MDLREPIIIVGAGCFGSSTALHLIRAGFKNVTILDKSLEIPSPDQASNDLNRIVRTSYSDPVYARLAKEAIESWKADAQTFGHAYHESGVLSLGGATTSQNFVQESYRNDVAMGSAVRLFPTAEAMTAIIQELGDLSGLTGYLNSDNGWADAGLAIRSLHSALRDLGCRFELGKDVTELVQRDGLTCGVSCADGSQFLAKMTIIATGAWTSSSFPSLRMEALAKATGQSVAMVQLTPEESKRYANVPVVLSFDDGFYIFPPTKDHILKFAIHGAGYVNPDSQGISTPRTIRTNPEDGHFIPKERVYPEFASKPIVRTRLCWYSDSYDGDWIIGRPSDDPGLVVATGDAGHAFKFLPVLGKLVVDAINLKLDPVLASKFAPDRVKDALNADPSRHGQIPARLRVEDLCTTQDYHISN
ncbi:FAD dependent oxidoreductase [Flagelloscypha sp. PMI_526]|nr:FAD dependent oxidoreductase [Flagelloscypha sp. PMI_526]